MGTYVDDCLNTGTTRLEKLAEMTLSKFNSKPRIYDSFDFYGTQLATIEKGSFHLSQKRYAKNIAYVEKNCSFEEYRRHRALFSWMFHTRSEVACHANKAAQVTEKTFSSEKILELNNEIHKIKSNVQFELTFKPIYLKSAHLCMYSDAFFDTNKDLSSQLG